MQPETVTTTPAAEEVDKTKFLIAALNGTALYVLAYYVVWAVHQAAKLEVSRFYHLRGTWDPSRIVYTLADGEWWRMAIIGVHGAGPVACVLMGMVAFRWYWRRERARRGTLKLLLLWIAFHCCNAVFGALLADTLTHSGFWYVSDWLLQLGNAVDVILALLAGMVQLALGYFGAIAFLQAHDSRTVMRYSHRQLMVVSTLIVPWLVGGACIALAKRPYLSVYEGVHLLMMGLLVTPLGLGCLNEVFSDTVERPQPTHVAWGLVALAVLMAVAWYMALSPPIPFG
ncbi:hypothetical protein [Hymenobacter negativus]|uniref:DUF2306 domain-containing protein n=1 Tax=Hymenobacter negativus TaxID=2795026 RepID=A0ABS3QIG0_9BACT|nr:hypothetical protein [Hymenobacter negativus]MBO2011021.1 hypothetical protein [Hymenobacter negativus]